MQRSFLSAFVLLVSCGSSAAESPHATTSAASEAPARAEPAGASAPADTSAHAILDAHNAHRADHCAPSLVWSEELAEQAQRWADHLAQGGCQLEHSQSTYGENLAAGTTGTLSPEDVVEMWYREIDQYDFGSGAFSMDTGHFTQLVWTSSTSLGCAMTTCDGLDLWVCNYDPPGNYDGEFQQRVLPTSCR